jgi:hypothetical protein
MKRVAGWCAAGFAASIGRERQEPECKDGNGANEVSAKVPDQPHATEELRTYEDMTEEWVYADSPLTNMRRDNDEYRRILEVNDGIE